MGMLLEAQTRLGNTLHVAEKGGAAEGVQEGMAIETRKQEREGSRAEGEGVGEEERGKGVVRLEWVCADMGSGLPFRRLCRSPDLTHNNNAH
jgi:hypothetical protein